MEEWDVICAGQICTDIIPDLSSQDGGLESVFIPGKHSAAGKIIFKLGGSVANTGLALHKIGMKTLLISKVGDDELGKMLVNKLAENVACSSLIKMVENVHTSYSIVITLPHTDRIFFT